MKTEQIVEALKDAARQLGLDVRVEQGNFRGGYCKVDGRGLIVLNKRHPPEVHLALLAESLHPFPTETVFLRPSVREALEEAWRRREQIETDDLDAA